MIRTVTIRVNAANPELPLERVETYQGSAVSLIILGVPAAVGRLSVTSLTLALTNSDGTTTAIEATRSGNAYLATIPSAAVGGPGTSLDGLVISATGTDERGNTETWIIGVGDLEVRSLEAVPTPGVTRQIVHAYHADPETPHFGDIAPVGGVLSYFDGTAWRSIEMALTKDQLAALNSGATAEKIAAIAGKLDKTGGEIDGDLDVTGDLTKNDQPVATTDQLDYTLDQSTVANRSIVDIPDAGDSGAAITVPAGFRDLLLTTHGKVASIAFADTGLSPFGDDLPTEGDNIITITRLPLNRILVKVVKMESKTYGN